MRLRQRSRSKRLRDDAMRPGGFCPTTTTDMNCAVTASTAEKRKNILLMEEEIYAYNKTHMFAMRLNCSNKFLGRKVMMVYLDVMTWFVI
jgi:hypothetical protein